MNIRIQAIALSLMLTALVNITWGSKDAAIPTDKEKFHIFILMGQSNMAGYGQILPGDDVEIDNVLELQGWQPEQYTWQKAAQPIHHRLGSDQFCLAGPFAESYRDSHPGITVGLIPVAWGGAAIDQINKGTKAYDDMLVKAKLAKTQGVIKGVLWHQGESDTVNLANAQQYSQKLKQLVIDIRSDLKIKDLPFIAGNLAEFYGTGPDHNAPQRVKQINMVKAALRNLPNEIANTGFVESAGLKAREKHQVHFDRDSLITFGKRYAAAFQNLQLNSEPQFKNRTDWLINPQQYQAGVYQGGRSDELVLSNGLIRRIFRIAPDGATVGFDNLMTSESVLRSVRPEAELTFDGKTYEVGGLKGQPNHAYLLPEWVDFMKPNPKAFHFVGYEIGKPQKTMEWKRNKLSPDTPWPPKGISLHMDYKIDPSVSQSQALLPSQTGRTLLISDDFKTFDKSWKEHHSSKHPRSSFTNEGKVGEIYTYENTAVYAERQLPADVKLVQCKISCGTDQGASWGPGITLLTSDNVLKFNIRPGEKRFGIYFKGREQFVGEVDPAKAYYLRIRIESNGIHCEASLDSQSWFTVGAFADKTIQSPATVRIGKTSNVGGNTDYNGAFGELTRCLISEFKAYGQFVPDPKIQDSNPHNDLIVSIHYELYDHIPVICKWFSIQNGSDKTVKLNSFVSEILAVVEAGSTVDKRQESWLIPEMHIESDYEFHGMDTRSANEVINWVKDPLYATQVNYQRETPCLLKTNLKAGPNIDIPSGEDFTSFRVYELLYDRDDRERKGLAQRRMYQTLTPWALENPLMMHVRSARPEAVRAAVDQCAAVGFEMIIMTFGSGFNIENESPAYLAQIKELVDYAHSKDIRLGGYSLLASRRVSDKDDVINPETGKPGGFATFGNSPCIESQWGQDYFRKLYNFFEKTGFDLLEHDGSYPGDFCASTTHPGHDGYEDSQWKQFKTISNFYKWCRAKGVHLNVPDYYFFQGSSKNGMGYRETNWSLPRAQQVIHARQNIYDGTWTKAPSMGWMFVPLTQYHGGGAAATVEPLSEHLDHYQKIMMSNLSMGVQACYRGPRIYDTDKTKAMVKESVDWFKKYRDILESDLIHGRRADGRDIDWMLHVNPQLKNKGMLIIFNPKSTPVKKTLNLPLYYTGLTDKATISHQGQTPSEYSLARDYSVEIEVDVPADSMTWYLIQ
ncbi:MAG: sialate O-acetylesterase [Phycisphaerae bacterium]|nr:sialate O-acetylesterase [Phycisphaerae bacterium]